MAHFRNVSAQRNQTGTNFSTQRSGLEKLINVD